MSNRSHVLEGFHLFESFHWLSWPCIKGSLINNNPVRDPPMIKKSAFIGLTFLCSSVASASPLYYTFTGSVWIVGDNANIITNTYGDLNDFIANTVVEYTFLVDTSAQGEFHYNNSVFDHFAVDSSSPELSVDTFYTDLISGSLIDELNGGYRNSDGDIRETNRGFYADYHPGTHNDQYQLVGGSGDNPINIFSVGLPTLALGSLWLGLEDAYDQNGLNSSYYSNLELSRISDVYPSISAVPLPAAIWLFGTALIGLVGFGKCRKAA